MVSLIVFSLLGLASAIVQASPSPLTQRSRNVFESQVQNDTKLRFVRNSGVCETTPGVGQISGYIDTGKNMSTVREECRVTYNLA